MAINSRMTLTLLAASLAISPVSSFAAFDLYGDMDCFGTNAVCTEGVALPGGFRAVIKTAEDPYPSDESLWEYYDTYWWTQTIGAGSYSNTSLEIRIIRAPTFLALEKVPGTVYVDDVRVGRIPWDDSVRLLVETFEFPFDSSLLDDGAVRIRVIPQMASTYAIDYSKVYYDVIPPAVPVPPAAPIPTLSQWALLLLTTLTAAIAFSSIRRRTNR
jgi:hypothetical protein